MIHTDVRILTEPLGGSALSRALQRGEAPVTWMPAAPSTPAEWRAAVTRRATAAQWRAVLEQLAPAIRATGVARDRLQRVAEGGGIVVTTGQQPGLFGGPIYTWSKAVSALAIANEIERVTGVPCAAVFWAATDDADFAEASFTMFATRDGVETVRTELAPPSGTPMSLAPLGDASAVLARLRAAAGSASDESPLEIAERAYGTPTRSIGDAYVMLLRGLLAPLGIPVLDASHDAVRAASDPILRRALECAPRVQDALAGRRREMLELGYEPQVSDVDSLSLVFVREGSIKRRASVAESAALAADRKAVLTPNVLLRPVVERELLPSIAYVAGPGEIAYFAQVSAVAEVLGVDRPVALPRWSCTLIEPHIAELQRRYGATPDALARPDAFEALVARASMGKGTADTLRELRDVIDKLPARLTEEASALGLKGAIDGAKGMLLHRADRLERRLLAGLKRREASAMRDIAAMRAALFPLGKRQERALNILPLLSRHGVALLGAMRESAAPHARVLISGGDGTAS